MIIGTAGHIDHGKTSLVRALTGVDTDRLKEEKRRGISIDLGFAYLPTPDGSIVGFVDVPGHERFVHTMLAGASGIDLALLVIAADDGPMPQTREHLAILELLGIRQGLVALTKVDLVDEARRAAAEAEVRALIAGTAFADAPILGVSTVTGEGVEALRAALLEAGAALGRRRDAGRFRLAVDRSFTLAGAGTVVTGTVLSGRVAVGDRVLVSPAGLAARVRSIHAQNRPAEEGRAGDRCALNLAGEGVTKDAIARGDMVVDEALHAPADRIDATLAVLPAEPKPIGQWFPVRLHHAAAEVGARVVLLGEEALAPGSAAEVQLVLERPIAAAAGDRFVLRDTSAQRTIGGGRFLDVRAPARKRRSAARRAQLAALGLDDPPAAVAALLEVEPHHLDLARFVLDRALEPQALEGLVARLGLVRLDAGAAVTVVSAERWAAFRAELQATLAAFHAGHPDLMGMGLERLRRSLALQLPLGAFKAALQMLVRAGDVATEGAWVRLPGHEVRLTEAEELAWRRIAPLLGGGERFRPPRVRDIAAVLAIEETEVRALLKLVGRLGQVDEVAHDHFFLRPTVAEMVEIAARLAAAAPAGQFTAAQFRDQLDNGRKVAIQILEFLDRHGVTLRRGDLRRINRHRLDLFAPLDQDRRDATSETSGRESSLVGRPGFKPGRGRETVLGGFDSHSLPPIPRGAP